MVYSLAWAAATGALSAAKRSHPTSEVRAAGRTYPTPEARGRSREEQPHLQGVVAARVQEGLEELLHVQGQEGQL